MRPVVGLRRFLLLETSEGLAMVAEAEDRAACEECARRADGWMRERLPSLQGYRPLTAVGVVIAEASALETDGPPGLRNAAARIVICAVGFATGGHS